MTAGLASIPLDRFRALREARQQVEELRAYALDDLRAAPLALAAQAAWEAEVDKVFRDALGIA